MRRNLELLIDVKLTFSLIEEEETFTVRNITQHIFEPLINSIFIVGGTSVTLYAFQQLFIFLPRDRFSLNTMFSILCSFLVMARFSHAAYVMYLTG